MRLRSTAPQALLNLLLSRATESRRLPSLTLLPAGSLSLAKTFFSPSRREAQVRNTLSDVVEFSGSAGARRAPEEIGLPGPGGPPDERTVKLGKTLRILQSRLPSVLASPLPTEILSPHISLHLFPSTHPHLPNVSGRVAYHAALWTSPITWGRVPLIGNVRLHIVSERMVKNGPSYHNTIPSNNNNDESDGKATAADRGTPMGEKLIVRWKTCARETAGNGSNGSGSGSGTSSGSQVLGKMAEWLGRVPAASGEGGGLGGGSFEGLFIFEFDEEGRIISHTIERAEQSGNWDQGVGKWVGLTDWLLGRLGRREEMQPGLALGYIRDDTGRSRPRFGRD